MKLPTAAARVCNFSFGKFIIFFFIFGIHIVQASASSSTTDWKQEALDDLEFVHGLIEQAHPGVLDKTDDAFQHWFSAGYQESKRLLSLAQDRKQARAALHYYTTGYADGHLALWPEVQPRQMFWAGWVIQKIGPEFLVTEVADHWPSPVPPLLSKVVSCDDMPVADYIEKHIAPYTDSRKLHISWQRNALKITADSPNESPLWNPTRSAQCTVDLPDGNRISYPLHWRAADNNAIKTTFSGRYPQRMYLLRDDVVWIHASNFQISKHDMSAFETLLEAIRHIDVPQAVVFDLRGNNGGDSFTGYRMLKALVKNRMPQSAPESVAFFRVSDISVGQFRMLQKHFMEVHGAASTEYQYVTEQYEGLLRAQSEKQDYFRQTDFDTDNLAEEPGVGFGGRLVLLTDSTCASACLDFMDMALALPGAIHLGLPTSGDTMYLEAAIQKTPSGANLAIPIKVWRNRVRGSNQCYTPRHLFTGDITDTEAVQDWVLRILSLT